MNDPKVMGIDPLTGLPAQELREDDQARKLVAALDGLVRSIRNREAREAAFRATIDVQAKEIERLRAALDKALIVLHGYHDDHPEDFGASAHAALWAAEAALKEEP